ncbi:mucin-1, partial [Psammomys obesus]|uniref:mucin-1 n=1 Tax=Psammomys obesus TaxID=48139 RepID=UPI0024532498
SPPVNSTSTPAHSATSNPASSPPVDSTSTSIQTTNAISGLASTPIHNGSLVPTSRSALGSATSPVHSGTSTITNSSDSNLATTPVYRGTSISTIKATSGSAILPGHNGSFVPTTSSVLGLATSPNHNISAMAPTTPVVNGTQSSVLSQHPVTPTTLATSGNSTVVSSTYFSLLSTMALSPTFSSTSSPQLSVGVTFFFLTFHIWNHQFNSSLEDHSSNYYQELKRNISGLFLQIFNQDFLGISTIKFRSGSVVVESTVIFQEGAVSASEVKSQLIQHEKEAEDYNLAISKVNVKEMQFPSSAQSWPGVPGWGIALLVLVCILVALAVIYLIALAVCQCRRKSYGQLDIFPTQDTYHPMSEYPTYHTHGRYVPPGSTKRSPYEEVAAGNGSSSLSYTNPTVATTSANL